MCWRHCPERVSRGGLWARDRRWVWQGRPTLNTLIWQLAECKCSVYSPLSFCLNVSICTRKGTPFSPPCFLGVNSVLIQCTWKGKRATDSKMGQGWALDSPRVPLQMQVPILPGQVQTCLNLPAAPQAVPKHLQTLGWANGLPCTLSTKDMPSHL